MKNTPLFTRLMTGYPSLKNSNLKGRYITYDHIQTELKKLPELYSVEEIGKSFLGTPIHSVTFGNGPVRVLAWSQMHGNESTTTKAVFDLFNIFSQERSEEVLEILKKCTLKFIPMLNPDGAVRYTRENVNGIDLNRDAQNLEEEESKILRKTFESFTPDFCLNLHDQRTIFSAGDTNKPATLSFLAPAMDETRSIPENRKKAMQLIYAINKDLQEYLPGQIGRYDDAFNLNCTGDSFQASGVPTILFEAGHYKEDYLREKTREFVALAILSALRSISKGDYERFGTDNYLEIPENRKNFFDVILRNALIGEEQVDVAIQFVEKIKSGKISFDPVVHKIESNLAFYGHQEIDCEGGKVQNLSEPEINENAIVKEILLNNNKLSIKTPENL